MCDENNNENMISHDMNYEQIKEVIQLKRNKINYLVDQIDNMNDYRISKKYLWCFTPFILICEVALAFIDYEGLQRVIESLLAPLVIGGLIMYIGNKAISYQIALGYENELFDICSYLKKYDKLKENEEYIIEYICTSKEKYTSKNKFDALKAKGVY